MLHVSCWFVLPLMLATPLAFSQQPPNANKGTNPLDADVQLLDRSNVRVKVLQESLEITTKYGPLTVPTKDILKIDFGIQVSPEMQQKVARVIDDLISENQKARELALKELTDLGPQAYAQVCAAAKSNQPLMAKWASVALDKIKAKHPASNLRLHDYDVITTTTFPIHGKVNSPTLKVKNETFGEVDLSLAKVRAIHCANGQLNMEVTVDAGRHGSTANQWMATDFEANSNLRIVIAASGTVDLWPQQGGGSNYHATPSGYRNGNGGVAAVAQAPGQFPPPQAPQAVPARELKALESQWPLNALPGMLLGKIGEDGPIFIIGDRFDGNPPRDGKLYLHIVPSPWGNASTGTYRVNITPKGGFGDN